MPDTPLPWEDPTDVEDGDGAQADESVAPDEEAIPSAPQARDASPAQAPPSEESVVKGYGIIPASDIPQERPAPRQKMDPELEKEFEEYDSSPLGSVKPDFTLDRGVEAVKETAKSMVRGNVIAAGNLSAILSPTMTQEQKNRQDEEKRAHIRQTMKMGFTDPRYSAALAEDPNADILDVYKKINPSYERDQKRPEEIHKLASDIAKNEWLKAGEKYKESSGFVEDFIGGSTQAAVQVGVGFLTGGIGSLALMFNQIWGNTTESLMKQDVKEESARMWGLVNAAAQAPMEQFGLSKLTAAFRGSKPLMRGLVEFVGRLATEGGVETLQNMFPERITTMFALHPDRTATENIEKFISEIGKNFPEDVYQGIIAALSMGLPGGAHAAYKTHRFTNTERQLKPLLTAEQASVYEALEKADVPIQRLQDYLEESVSEKPIFEGESLSAKIARQLKISFRLNGEKKTSAQDIMQAAGNAVLSAEDEQTDQLLEQEAQRNIAPAEGPLRTPQEREREIARQMGIPYEQYVAEKNADRINSIMPEYGVETIQPTLPETAAERRQQQINATMGEEAVITEQPPSPAAISAIPSPKESLVQRNQRAIQEAMPSESVSPQERLAEAPKGKQEAIPMETPAPAKGKKAKVPYEGITVQSTSGENVTIKNTVDAGRFGFHHLGQQKIIKALGKQSKALKAAWNKLSKADQQNKEIGGYLLAKANTLGEAADVASGVINRDQMLRTGLPESMVEQIFGKGHVYRHGVKASPNGLAGGIERFSSNKNKSLNIVDDRTQIGKGISVYDHYNGDGKLVGHVAVSVDPEKLKGVLDSYTERGERLEYAGHTFGLRQVDDTPKTTPYRAKGITPWETFARSIPSREGYGPAVRWNYGPSSEFSADEAGANHAIWIAYKQYKKDLEGTRGPAVKNHSIELLEERIRTIMEGEKGADLADTTVRLVQDHDLQGLAKVIQELTLGRVSFQPFKIITHINTNVNGFFDTKEEIFFYNIDSDKAALLIMGHELGHWLEKVDPVAWGKFRDHVMSFTGKEGFAEFRRRIEDIYRKMNPGISEEAFKQTIEREYISEVFANLGTEAHFWRSLYKKDKTLFQQIASFISRILSTLKGKKWAKSGPEVIAMSRLESVQEAAAEAWNSARETIKAQSLSAVQTGRDQVLSDMSLQRREYVAEQNRLKKYEKQSTVMVPNKEGTFVAVPEDYQKGDNLDVKADIEERAAAALQREKDNYLDPWVQGTARKQMVDSSYVHGRRLAAERIAKTKKRNPDREDRSIVEEAFKKAIADYETVLRAPRKGSYLSATKWTSMHRGMLDEMRDAAKELGIRDLSQPAPKAALPKKAGPIVEYKKSPFQADIEQDNMATPEDAYNKSLELGSPDAFKRYLEESGYTPKRVSFLVNWAKTAEKYPYPSPRQTADRILEIYKRNPAEIFWYENSRFLREIFSNDREIDVFRGLAMIAHTSRNSSPLSNISKFIAAWKVYKGGKTPKVALMEARKIEAVLSAENLEAMFEIRETTKFGEKQLEGERKVREFAKTFKAVWDNDAEARAALESVVDIWMGRYFYPDLAVKILNSRTGKGSIVTPARTDRINAHMRAVEDLLTKETGMKWYPDMAQAGVWFWTKKDWEERDLTKPVAGYSFDQTLQISAGNWISMENFKPEDVPDDVTMSFIHQKLRDPNVRYVLDHWTRESNDFIVADPAMQGTGKPGEEWWSQLIGFDEGDIKSGAVKPIRPLRIHFYAAGTKPELIFDGGFVRMRTVIDSDKIYPIDKDPLGLLKKHNLLHFGKKDPIFLSKLEKELVSSGYIGFSNLNGLSKPVIVIFEKTRVDRMQRYEASLSAISSHERIQQAQDLGWPHKAERLSEFLEAEKNGDFKRIFDMSEAMLRKILDHPLVDIRGIYPAQGHWQGTKESGISVDLDSGDMTILTGLIAKFLDHNIQAEGYISKPVGVMNGPPVGLNLSGIMKNQQPSAIFAFDRALTEAELIDFGKVISSYGIDGFKYVEGENVIVIHHVIQRSSPGNWDRLSPESKTKARNKDNKKIERYAEQFKDVIVAIRSEMEETQSAYEGYSHLWFDHQVLAQDWSKYKYSPKAEEMESDYQKKINEGRLRSQRLGIIGTPKVITGEGREAGELFQGQSYIFSGEAKLLGQALDARAAKFRANARKRRADQAALEGKVGEFAGTIGAAPRGRISIKKPKKGSIPKGHGKIFADVGGRVKNPKKKKGIDAQSVLFDIESFHGSPRVFDTVSTANIGSGQGSKSFGWGLYFTSLRDIADIYAKVVNLTKVQAINAQLGHIVKEMDKHRSSGQEYGKFNSPEGYRLYEKYKDLLNEKTAPERNPGNVYTATLFPGKDADQYHLIDWHKKIGLSAAEKIASQAEKEGLPFAENYRKNVGKDAFRDGKEFYEDMTMKLGGEKEASLFLKRAGIDGIQYESGSISAKQMYKEPGINYVIFDDKDVKLTSRESEGIVNILADIEKTNDPLLQLDTETRETETIDRQFSSYRQGEVDTSEDKNIWVKQENTPNSERVLLVQISAKTDPGKGLYADFADQLYGKRGGFLRPTDFWEIPYWIATAAKTIDNSDLYVVRNIDEAIKFLGKSNYGTVMFSVMEDHKIIVKDIVDSYDGKVVAGGYVDPAYFADNKNLTWSKDIQEAYKNLGKGMREGTDYRHFAGTQTIPRLEFSKGCLHGCLFCDIPKNVVAKNWGQILEQLNSFKGLDYDLVYLNDKTFGQAKNYELLPRAMEVIKQSNPNFQGFVIQTTASQFMKFSDDFLQKSGIKYVELGVESFNDPILKSLKKPHVTKQIESAAKRIRENKMAFIPNVMVGLTGQDSAGKQWTESRETYENTLAFLKKNSDIISHLNTYVLALHSGTKLSSIMLNPETAEMDSVENIIEKSWMEGDKTHEEYFVKMMDFSKAQLDKHIGVDRKMRKGETRDLGLMMDIDIDAPQAIKDIANQKMGYSPTPISARVKTAAQGFKENFVTDYLDKLNPIRSYLGDSESYFMHRGLGGLSSTMTALMEHGKLKWDGNALTTDTVHKGFIPFLREHRQDIDKFFMWLVAKRSALLEGQGREKLITDADRQTIYQWVGNRPVTAASWEDLNKEFQAFNNSVLDMAEAAGVIDPDSRAVFQSDYYIPFYRIFEDENANAEFMKQPGGRSRAFINQQIKRLMGSEKKLGDPLGNVLKNWMGLVRTSMENKARMEAFNSLENSGKLGPQGEPIVERVDWKDTVIFKSVKGSKMTMVSQKTGDPLMGFRDGGKTVYFKVNDPMLFQAMSNIDGNKEFFDNIIFKIMGLAKRGLTFGATITPAFRIANALRDTLHTSVISKNFMPFVDTMRGMIKVMRNDSEYVKMLASGHGFAGDYLQESDTAAQYIRKIVKREGQGARGWILNTPGKIWGFWQKIGEASENAARVQLYSNLRAKGTSHLASSFAARDLLDFQMSGKSAALRTLTSTIPFLNARIQGLYRMGRGFMENPAGFMLKGGMVAAASLALWAWNRDDDRWKRLENWEKWSYYHTWIGDVHIRIPKPFEVGALFSSSFESAAEVAYGNEDLDFIASWLKFTAMDTLAFNPVPQAARPIAEQVMNRSFFTGRPIEPLGMEHRKPGERFDPWDSKFLQAVGKQFDISPKRGQALIEGYLSSVGVGILYGADLVTRQVVDFPENPTRPMSQYPVMGRFIREAEPPGSTKYTSKFYSFLQEVQELHGQATHYMKTGRSDDAWKLYQDNPKAFALYPQVMSIRQKLINLGHENKRVWLDKNLSPEQKRQKLDAISVQRTDLTKRIYQYIKEVK